jgi:hypothetical protein
MTKRNTHFQILPDVNDTGEFEIIWNVPGHCYSFIFSSGVARKSKEKNLTSIPSDTVTFRKGSTTLIFNTGQAKLDLHKVLSALRQIFPTCTDGYKTFIQWQVYLLINSWYHASTSWTEAKLLDEIQTKVLRVFFLAIHGHLYSFALRFLFLQTHATSYSFYSVLLYAIKEKGGKPDRKPHSFPMV